jgi:hypothetical protein
VNFLDYSLPAGEGFLTIHVWDIRQVLRLGMMGSGTLGKNQRNTGFRATPVISGYVRAWHAGWRKIAGHRRHHNTIRQHHAL